MKKKLEEFDSLCLLSRSTAMQSECLYLLNSESSSRNLYFTSKRDIEFAHRMIKRHLSDVMDIITYLFTPEGWILVISTHSEEAILNKMRGKKYLSKKLRSMVEIGDISGILSEQVRKMISCLARQINRHNNRQGVLVKHCFSRYIFMTLEEGIQVMRYMKNQEIRICKQNRSRYRPQWKFWDIKGELIKGDVFLSMRGRGGRWGRGVGGQIEIFDFDQLLDIAIKSINVLRDLVKSSLFAHLLKTKNTNSKKSSIITQI